MIALQALSQFAALVHSDTFDANSVITGTAWSHSASITNDNRLLLQKREGRALPSKLNYDVSGTGCVLLQVKIHIFSQSISTRSLLTVTITESSPGHSKVLWTQTICNCSGLGDTRLLVVCCTGPKLAVQSGSSLRTVPARCSVADAGTSVDSLGKCPKNLRRHWLIVLYSVACPYRVVYLYINDTGLTI